MKTCHKHKIGIVCVSEGEELRAGSGKIVFYLMRVCGLVHLPDPSPKDDRELDNQNNS